MVQSPDTRPGPMGAAALRPADGPIEQARLLHAGLPAAIAGNLLVGAITVGVLWNVVPFPAVPVWFGVFAGVQAARAALFLSSRRGRLEHTGRRWRTLLRAGALLSGAAWGAVPVLLFPPQLPHQVFLAFVAAGVTGAALAGLAADGKAALLFIVPALAPLIVRLFIAGGEIPAAMGAMALLYLVYLAAAARRGERAFRESLALRDRIDRQNAELRESQRLARLGSWSLDVASGRLQWSEEVYAIFGRDPATFTPDQATYYRELMHPDDVAAVKQQLEAACGAPGQRYDIDHRVRRPDGTVRWVHVEGVASVDGAGRSASIVGTVQDITERRKALADLDRFKRLLDDTYDSIFMFDPDTLRFVYLNRGAVESTGYTRAELLELAPYRIKPLMPEPVFRARLAPLLTGEKTVLNFETVHRRKDGSEFPVDVSVQLVRESGRRGVFVAIVRDITARKQVERLKSEFVSTVSHELRTPLTSIRGALGLLEGGAAGELPEKGRELVRIAHRNAQRLARLINDILDIEKIASGKMQFDVQPYPLMALVEQAVAANQSYAGPHGVQIRIAARVGPEEVRVDAGRFQQMMDNLLSNAARFSPTGATVEVAVERRPDHLQVSISDRGPGIPAEFRAHVFEKFSQADASDTRARGGSGLGLAITREIVEAMGGRIGFDTEEGVGTTFRVEFPLWRRPTVTDRARLLVVEDDPDVARLLALTLEQGGYAADIAPSAEEAKRRLARGRYDALTLDLALPGQDGISFIRELRADPATRELPVVVVSARVEEGRLAIGGDFSAVDWLAKPIEASRLRASVRRALAPAHGGTARVLHVEDGADADSIGATRGENPWVLDRAGTVSEARHRLGLGRYALIILDPDLPDGSGWELLPDISALSPPPAVVVLSGEPSSGAEARRASAAFVGSKATDADLLRVLADATNRPRRLPRRSGAAP